MAAGGGRSRKDKHRNSYTFLHALRRNKITRKAQWECPTRDARHDSLESGKDSTDIFEGKSSSGNPDKRRQLAPPASPSPGTTVSAEAPPIDRCGSDQTRPSSAGIVEEDDVEAPQEDEDAGAAAPELPAALPAQDGDEDGKDGDEKDRDDGIEVEIESSSILDEGADTARILSVAMTEAARLSQSEIFPADFDSIAETREGQGLGMHSLAIARKALAAPSEEEEEEACGDAAGEMQVLQGRRNLRHSGTQVESTPRLLDMLVASDNKNVLDCYMGRRLQRDEALADGNVDVDMKEMMEDLIRTSFSKREEMEVRAALRQKTMQAATDKVSQWKATMAFSKELRKSITGKGRAGTAYGRSNASNFFSANDVPLMATDSGNFDQEQFDRSFKLKFDYDSLLPPLADSDDEDVDEERPLDDPLEKIARQTRSVSKDVKKVIKKTADELSASPFGSLVCSLVDSAEEVGVGSMFFSTLGLTSHRAHSIKSSQFSRS